MIAAAANAIAEMAFLKLEQFQDNLEQAVEKLEAKVEALKDLTGMVHAALDEDLTVLSEVQAELPFVDVLEQDEEGSVLRTAVSDGLAQKKALRTNVINALAAAYGLTGMIESLTNELDQMAAPLLEEFLETQGQV
jgi:hypothetical protein